MTTPPQTLTNDDWRARWKEGRTAFHEGKPNGLLAAHPEVLGTKKRVFVPLCGKTEDMVFLAQQGHTVVGVELVEDAVRAFFEEHGLNPTVTKEGALVRYEHGPYVLFAGDLFATTRESLGGVNALYDRASIVALPLEMRIRHAAHLLKVLEPGSPGLVIAFEYDQTKRQGPPWSVSETELRGHFGETLALVDSRPTELGKGSDNLVETMEKLYQVRLHPKA